MEVKVNVLSSQVFILYTNMSYTGKGSRLNFLMGMTKKISICMSYCFRDLTSLIFFFSFRQLNSAHYI